MSQPTLSLQALYRSGRQRKEDRLNTEPGEQEVGYTDPLHNWRKNDTVVKHFFSEY